MMVEHIHSSRYKFIHRSVNCTNLLLWRTLLVTLCILSARSTLGNALNNKGTVNLEFCKNISDLVSDEDGEITTFSIDKMDNVRYPFWIKCQTSLAGVEYNLPEDEASESSRSEYVQVSEDKNMSAESDDRYAYLVDIASVCKPHLLTCCKSTFLIGLSSQQDSTKCPTCGQNDSNCDNVHQCTSDCGQIRSVHYPFNYGNNHRCRWSIRAPDGHYVNLSIIDFDIPSADNATKLGTCIFDYLTLIDGYTGKRIGCYCNENLPPPYIVSPWNELIIQFDTNSETTGRGFYFKYEFMKLQLSERVKRLLRPYPSSSDLSILDRGNNMFCPNGWQYFRGSCYKAYNEIDPLQWYDAENKCNAFGEGLDGHLVSILDRDEMLVIQWMLTNVWRSARYKEYYIGLIDVTREGVYRWSDNNPMSYTDWELRPMLLEDETPAQPDGGAYEDCTVIRYNSFSRTSNWHDVPCSLGKHYQSHHEINIQIGYKWDYVNSYICKSDSISPTSPSKVRRPLFSPNHPVELGARTTSRHQLFDSNRTSSLFEASNEAMDKARLYLALSFSRMGLNYTKYFVCDNSEIISVVLRCDGVAHCRDGSDESHGCDTDCLDWQFKCANGRCISIGKYCNFVDDCGDGSDEARCERHRCKLNEFKCNSGQCIMAHQRCDLLPDCSDSSDESRACTIGSHCNAASTFQCYNGYCIPHYAVCDFQIDCPGKFHEDEDAATCDVVLKNRSHYYESTTIGRVGNDSPVVFYQAKHEALGGWKPKTLFKCTSGNMIDKSLRCLYEFDRYGYQIGCRDVSHLIDCEDFQCPDRDYVKCSNSYCIPWRYICDGKWDCILGDDEVGCARYVCPGQYKCANQSSCILLHQLCDGHRQCPMGDDEWFCDLQCPSNCKCIGQSINCLGANMTNLPPNFVSKSVRKLDLSYNKLGPNLTNCDFSTYHDLGELILQHNGIEVLIPRKFSQLRNLYKLDLSNNQIHSVKRGAFANLRRVTQLLLESNPELVNLEPEAFLGLSSLQILNISSSRIQAVRKNTFDGLTSLRQLLLRSNMIVEIEDGAFRSLTSLVSLDLRGNDIRYFTKLIFTDLKSLRNLSTDSFKFCCLVEHQIPADRCLPLPDEISDCEDLLSSVPQRTCIWIAGGIACVGNLIVIIWRYRDRLGQKEREQEHINSTLLLSLGCSDLLMGIYLIVIASVDSWYRGRYIENADNWRESIGCNICGLLSTVSSSVSVLTLVFIAYNRYIEICRPFNSRSRFTLGYTYRLIVALWLIALTIAAAPLIIWPYFRGQFYARSGVCLAFHITDQRTAGWLYSIVFLPGINLFAFMLIVNWYIQIYAEISRASRPNQIEQSNHQVKIILIILTHFVAFSPPIILSFMKLANYTPPAAVYSWIAVLILPVNSAINPMIYTIPNIRETIRLLINNYRARKSGALAAGGRSLLTGVTINGQSAKELSPLANRRTSTRQRLAQRNVPPGYVPLKQFIRQADRVNAQDLVKIALGVARDLEEKHRDSVVYSSLSLDDIFVSNKLVSPLASANNTLVKSASQTNALQLMNSTNAADQADAHLCVFIADHCGYRRSNCSHGSSSSANNSCNHQHHAKRKSSRGKDTNCECSDVGRFGDILFKLIQLYNNRKLDQTEETKHQQLVTVKQLYRGAASNANNGAKGERES